MEPTNTTPLGKLKSLFTRAKSNKKPAPVRAPVKPAAKKSSWKDKFKSTTSGHTEVEFLPDADEIERTPIPAYARITLHVLATAFFLAILWASVSTMETIVTAHGRLITPLPNISVQPLEASIVQFIHVRTGQVVKKGERLATLDSTITRADETEIRARLYSLNNQLKQLEAELVGEQALTNPNDADAQLQTRVSTERRASYSAQLSKLNESAGRLRATLDTHRRDELTQASRVKVLRDIENMQQELVDKKLAARSRLLEAQDRRIEAERNMDMARNHQVEVRRELAALEAEKRSFETGWRQKMMEDVLTITRERDSLKEQLNKADMRNKLITLTSPSDAVVLEISPISQGSVVQAAEKLFTLVPLGGELEAEVQIDSLDIGFVKVGDKAHVKFDAYPFQKHGSMDATLRLVSQDAFRREGNGTGLDGYYTGRVKLASNRLDKMPEHAKLLPGMTLSAELVVGKRSVISYLLWPLTKAMNESMREP